MNDQLEQTGEDWAGRARALQALLDELRPQLIDAEAQLAERLAAISAFEFQLRARLESLSRRLDALQAEIDALRQALRRYRDSFLNWDDAQPRRETAENWRFEETAGASGTFRYRAKAETPRPAPRGSVWPPLSNFTVAWPAAFTQTWHWTRSTVPTAPT